MVIYIRLSTVSNEQERIFAPAILVTGPWSSSPRYLTLIHTFWGFIVSHVYISTGKPWVERRESVLAMKWNSISLNLGWLDIEWLRLVMIAHLEQEKGRINRSVGGITSIPQGIWYIMLLNDSLGLMLLMDFIIITLCYTSISSGISSSILPKSPAL